MLNIRYKDCVHTQSKVSQLCKYQESALSSKSPSQNKRYNVSTLRLKATITELWATEKLKRSNTELGILTVQELNV